MAEEKKTAEKILLEIVTPERVVVREEVDEVILPGIEGEFGVLPWHIPFLTALKVGELVYKGSGGKEHLAVSWGYVEVTSHSVKVLAETAEKAVEIDRERAEMAKAEAEKILSAGADDPDFEKAQATLEKAMVRMQVAGRK